MIAATYYKYDFSTIEGYLEGKPQKIKISIKSGFHIRRPKPEVRSRESYRDMLILPLED